MSAGEDKKWNGKITSSLTDKIIHLFVIKSLKVSSSRVFFCILISPNSGGWRLGSQFSVCRGWKILKLFVSLWENDKWALFFLRRLRPTSPTALCWAAWSFSSHLFFLCSEISVPNSKESAKSKMLLRFLPSNCVPSSPIDYTLWRQTNCSIYEPLVFVNKKGKWYWS